MNERKKKKQNNKKTKTKKTNVIKMMKLKMKKIHQAEKKGIVNYLSTLHPPPKTSTEEVLLKVHKFCVFVQWLLQGLIETPIFILFFPRSSGELLTQIWLLVSCPRDCLLVVHVFCLILQKSGGQLNNCQMDN